MVSALESGSSGPGLIADQGQCVLGQGARQFTFTVPLSTLVYKYVLPNLMLASHPGGICKYA